MPGTKSGPPPLPRSPTGAPAFAAPAAAHRTLTVVYQGERHPVSKDRFVIGRGKQSSDLTIRDPNVSRQHALIEHADGQYYIVDLGSTNGIEFQGQRVQRQLIVEGTVLRICDHEVHFTFA